MEYTQPPAIVERIQEAVPSCQSLVDMIKKGYGTHLVFRGRLNEDSLRYFPSNNNIQFKTKVDEDATGWFSKNFRQKVSHAFYRFHDSTKPWDVAVTYLIDNNMPILLYVARGEPSLDFKILDQHDIMFDFYQNPVVVTPEKFDFNGLKRYAVNVVFTCSNHFKSYLEEQKKKEMKKYIELRQKPQSNSRMVQQITHLPIKRVLIKQKNP